MHTDLVGDALAIDVVALPGQEKKDEVIEEVELVILPFTAEVGGSMALDVSELVIVGSAVMFKVMDMLLVGKPPYEVRFVGIVGGMGVLVYSAVALFYL